MKWEMVKLGELCTIFGGGTPDRAKPGYWGGSIPWVTVKDFKSNTIDSAQESITELGLKNSASNLVKAGTIIVPTRMALGKAAVCTIDIAINQDLKSIYINNKNKLDRDYLLHFLISNSSYFESRGKGATVKGITLDVLREIPIPLPPLATQKRIAEILDKADAMRQKDQALLRKYDELAQAVFVDMFGDPVKNEKGWEKYRFDQIFDSRLGKMLDAKKQTRKNAYKYLGNSNVLWGKFNMNNLHEMDFDDKDRRIFKLQKGDLLICEGGEVGRTAIWEGKLENVFFQKAIHRARPIEKNITPEFAMKLMWFLAKFGGLDDYVTSATIAHLTGEKLKTIMIPLPPIDLQQRFSNCLHNINIQKGQLEQDSSESLFQSLLQKAFTGELVA